MEKGKEREKEKGEWRWEMGDGRKKMGEVVNKVINDFGVDKANQMIKLVEEFSDSVYRNVR